MLRAADDGYSSLASSSSVALSRLAAKAAQEACRAARHAAYGGLMREKVDARFAVCTW